jgi:hypothetical protein
MSVPMFRPADLMETWPVWAAVNRAGRDAPETVGSCWRLDGRPESYAGLTRAGMRQPTKDGTMRGSKGDLPVMLEAGEAAIPAAEPETRRLTTRNRRPPTVLAAPDDLRTACVASASHSDGQTGVLPLPASGDTAHCSVP